VPACEFFCKRPAHILFKLQLIATPGYLK